MLIEGLGTEQIVAAAGDDMYAQVAVANGTVDRAWASGGAVLWANTYRHRPSLSGVGPPDAIASALSEILAVVPGLTRVSLPRGFVRHLPDPTLVGDLSDWDWLWAVTAPPQVPGEERVGWLGRDAHGEVATLLTEVSPGASAWPGDERAQRWAGIRDERGRLLACLADTSRCAAVGHVSSVATAPGERRKGYGSALTAWLTRAFFAEGRASVTLGMYADNDAARAMYNRLGFTCEHAFTGAALTRRVAEPAAAGPPAPCADA